MIDRALTWLKRAGILIACTSAAAFCLGVAIQVYLTFGVK